MPQDDVTLDIAGTPDAAVDPQDEAPTSEEPMSDLRAELAEANDRADKEHDAYLRALADFANYKRRTEEERASQRGFINEKLLLSLLPIVDNFERAVQSATTTKDLDKLLGGVELILRQLQEFLTREGVTPIDAVGQTFDPNFHNAVIRHETDEHPENTVVEELQKGYTLGDRVLRPTMVKVATGSE